MQNFQVSSGSQIYTPQAFWCSLASSSGFILYTSGAVHRCRISTQSGDFVIHDTTLKHLSFNWDYLRYLKAYAYVGDFSVPGWVNDYLRGQVVDHALFISDADRDYTGIPIPDLDRSRKPNVPKEETKSPPQKEYSLFSWLK